MPNGTQCVSWIGFTGFVQAKRYNLRITLPSYSRLERTSGAMYAGVPTVDLGLECSREDCKHKNEKGKSIS